MKFALYLQNYDVFGDVGVLVDLARDAEQAGWEGFFLWDHVARPEPTEVADPWVALAAIAASTRRIRIGTSVTPVPRRRPWKLARETVSVDRLSGGRLVLGVGIGSSSPPEWDHLGEETDERTRGAMLDEGLEVLTGLWSGEPFRYEGEHYRLEESQFLPVPAQQPRIPVWVAAIFPARPPLRRAARWDGVFPLFPDWEADNLAQLREVVAYVREHRTSAEPFDVVVQNRWGERDPAAYVEAGATWLLERLLPEEYEPDPLPKMREVVRAGPRR